VARGQAIADESLAAAQGIAAAVLGAMGEFDEAAVLGSATVPVLSIGSASPTNSVADLVRPTRRSRSARRSGPVTSSSSRSPDQVTAMI
jgi:hypothetical protein